ncbi:MAG: hypothetical protein H7327_04570 [Herminiimonas sp.]|nr:hypothetical protein [Herminiimonas sp.]
MDISKVIVGAQPVESQKKDIVRPASLSAADKDKARDKEHGALALKRPGHSATQISDQQTRTIIQGVSQQAASVKRLDRPMGSRLFDWCHPEGKINASTTVHGNHRSAEGTSILNKVTKLPGAAALTRESPIFDLRTATQENGVRTEGASSHVASFVRDADGNQYRIKHNHHGALAVWHEVLSARAYKLLGYSYAPEVKFSTSLKKTASENQTGVAIASRMVDGFRDWGSFLLDRKVVLKYVPAKNTELYEALLKAHKEISNSKSDLEKNIGTLLKDPKRDFNILSKTENEQLAPVRTYAHRSLKIQDQMLSLLPDEFRDVLIEALYASEAVGNWDFANHERANAGFVIDRKGKLVGATAIDFGNSGLNGFTGKIKDQSEESIVRPARIDDPFLIPRSTASVTAMSGNDPQDGPIPRYMPGLVLDKKSVTAFTVVSPSAGLIGSMPRSSSFANLMSEVIRDERDFYSDLAPREGESGIKPPSMLKTAFRLSLIEEKDLYALFNASREACINNPDPGIKKMMALVNFEDDALNALSRMYFTRFSNIVRRSGTVAIEAWADKHPLEARQIRIEVKNATEQHLPETVSGESAKKPTPP